MCTYTPILHVHTAIEVESAVATVTGTATLFCRVTGLTDTGAVTYQWGQMQGREYPNEIFPREVFQDRATGHTSDTLRIANVRPLDNTYDYFCNVSTIYGGRLLGSWIATLTTIGRMFPSILFPPFSPYPLPSPLSISLTLIPISRFEGFVRKLVACAFCFSYHIFNQKCFQLSYF